MNNDMNMRSIQARIRKESETDLIDDKMIPELVYLWTGKGMAGQHEALNKRPVGKHWANTLVEESADHMKKIAMQMTDSDLVSRLNDMHRHITYTSQTGIQRYIIQST